MELVKHISIRELINQSGLIYVNTPGGEYAIEVGLAAKAMSIDVVNMMVDLGPIRSIAEEMRVLRDSLENPEKIIRWMMGSTEWSDWIGMAKRVGDNKSNGNGFWMEESNFKIV